MLFKHRRFWHIDRLFENSPVHSLKTMNRPQSSVFSKSFLSRLFPMAGLGALLVSGGGAMAQGTLYWDTNGTTAGAGAAGGTWDTGTNWTSDAAGLLATTAWVDGSNVIFSAGTDATAAKTVTIGGTIATPSIVLEEVSLVTLSGGTIDITGGSIFNTSVLGATNGRSLTWSSAIIGTGDLTLQGHGDTSLTGGGSNTIFTLSGTNTFTGTVNITSGVIGGASNFGNAANSINLNGGGLVFSSSGSFARNISVGAGGGALRLYGAVTTTLSGALSGNGALTRTDGGTAIFNGDLSGFTGTINQGVSGTTRFDSNAAASVYNLTAGNLVFAGTTAASTLNWTAGSLQVGNNGTTGSASGLAGIAIANNQVLTLRRTDAGVNVSSLLPTTVTFGNNLSRIDYVSTSATGSATLDFDIGSTTANGILRVGGGTFSLASGTDLTVNSVQMALQSASNQGVLSIQSGSTLTTRYFNIGDGSGQSGIINQSGGSVVLEAGSDGFRIGHWSNGGNPGSVYNLSGGTLDATALSANAGSARLVNVGWDGSGQMTVGGGAGAATLKAFGIQLDANGDGGGDSVLTLSNNGVIEIGAGGIFGAAAADRLVLNGGSVTATANTTIGSVMDATTATTSDLNPGINTLTVSGNVTGSGTMSIGSGTGSVTFSTTGTQSVAAALAGSGNLAKVGTGTTTISGTGTHSGAFAVNAGTLNLTGTVASNLTVASGAILSGEGTAGSVTMTGGGILAVDPATPGSITFGNASFSGVNTVRVSPLPTSPVVNLFSYTGSLTGTLGTDLVLENASSYRSPAFSNAGGLVSVNLGSKNLTWNGTSGGQWNLLTSNRWNAGEVDQFAYADNVLFDDTGVATNITLTGDLRPSLVTVNSNTNNYTFNSSSGNAINGASQLIKDGSSTLTLAGPNGYTGGSLLRRGETRVRTAGALGTGSITLGDAGTGSSNVSLYLDTNRVNFGTNVIISSAHTGTGTVTIGSRSTVGGSGDNNQFTSITLQRDVIFDSNAADRTDYENISGTGNIRVTGSGRGIFVTDNLAWTGNLTVATSGGLQVGVASGAGNRIPDATNVTVETGGLLRLSTTSETIAGLNGGGTINANSPSGGTATLTVGFGNASGSFSGTLAGSTGGSIVALTKIGTGTQILSGTANTYSGLTSINGGVLAITSDASLGAAPTGALRRINLTAGGTGYTAAPAVTITAAPGAAGSGATATSTVASGAVTAVTLGAAGTGYTSIPTVTFGTPGSGATAQAELLGQVTMAGGTLRTDAAITSARSFQINTGGGTIDTNGFDSTISGGFAGSSAFTKSGAGKLTLTGVSSFTGTATVTGGTLAFSGGGQLFRTGAFFGATGTSYLNVNAGATAEFNRFNYGPTNNLAELRNNFYTLTVNGGTLRWVGTDAANGTNAAPASRAFTIGSAGATLEVAAGGTYYKAAGIAGDENIIRGASGGNITLAGDGYGEIRDGLGTYGTWTTGATITKNGAGSWRLTGGNTLTGATTVNNGSLILSGGENRLSTSSAIIVNSGGVLDVQGTNAIRRSSSDASITINGGVLKFSNGATHSHLSAINLQNGGTLTTEASAGSYNSENALLRGNVTVSGTGASTISLKDGLALDGIRTFDVADTTGDSAGDLLVTAELENSDGAFPTAGISKSGLGTMVLSANNTYNSTTTISAGTLQIGAGGTTGSLGGGAVTNNAGLVINRSNAYALANSISGTGSLTHTGSGTTTLTGTTLDYSGATTVVGGVLVLASGTTLANSTVTVQSGAEFRLQGTASAGVTVQSGGKLTGGGSLGGLISVTGELSPGNSPGTITSSGGMAFTSTAILNWELEGGDTTVGGSINDWVNITSGDLILDGTLNIIELGSFLAANNGDRWTLISYSGGFTDNGLNLGSTPALSGGLTLSIDTSVSGKVDLVVVPEPTAVALAASALVFALRRRRELVRG